LSSKRERVLGDEVKEQLLERAGFSRARAQVGSNRSNFLRCEPVSQGAFADAETSCDVGQRRPGQHGSDGLGAQLGRVGDTAWHSHLAELFANLRFQGPVRA
jgi:hypothetical protein